MPRQSDGLELMVRALNTLYDRFRRAAPRATAREAEDAMYAYLRRCERARNRVGKEWMEIFAKSATRIRSRR